VLSGERIDAAQAQRIGLISRLCEASALGEQTAALAAKMAAKPPLAMQLALLLISLHMLVHQELLLLQQRLLISQLLV
jgi:enoyl-CoA hydratase/carnithine racemase